MKSLYFIEIDLDEKDLDIKDVLSEHDPKVKVKPTRFKSFDEYEDFIHSTFDIWM